MHQATKNSTAAIVVTYFPDAEFLERITKLTEQFCKVIVVDNASDGVSKKVIDELPTNITCLSNNTNLGIAAALNQGISLAKSMAFDWVVTFDQDSIILTDFLNNLINIQNSLENKHAVVGSNFFDKNRDKSRFSCKSSNKDWQARTTVITSGMLLPTGLLEEIGGFREDYFIDAVDHEFCLRARSNNYQVILACKPLMQHEIGHAFSRRLQAVKKYAPYSHPPFRKYYMVRNTCYTIGLYWHTEPLWCLRRIVALIVKLVCILVEKNRKKQLKAFFSGMRDGICGKLGKI